MFKIKAFHADEGDSFLVSYGKDKITNLLIDGGKGRVVFKELKKEILELKKLGQKLDFIIVTHIDSDHIDGILKLAKAGLIESTVECVYFNSKVKILKKMGMDDIQETYWDENKTKISYRQGTSLYDFLEEKHIKNELIFFDEKNPSINLNDAVLTVLTPNLANLSFLATRWEKTEENLEGKKISYWEKNEISSIEELAISPFEEDKSLPNATSVSFVIEYEGYSICMLSDAQPTTVLKNLEKVFGKPIDVDILKVSHHGSKKNTNLELLRKLKTEKFLISCKENNKHGFPNKETLARIVKNNFDSNKKTSLFFNYPFKKRIFSEEEIEKYGVELFFSNDIQNIIEIELQGS